MTSWGCAGHPELRAGPGRQDAAGSSGTLPGTFVLGCGAPQGLC